MQIFYISKRRNTHIFSLTLETLLSDSFKKNVKITDSYAFTDLYRERSCLMEVIYKNPRIIIH